MQNNYFSAYFQEILGEITTLIYPLEVCNELLAGHLLSNVLEYSK